MSDVMDDLIIGAHVSFNKDTQLLGSVEEALSYQANTFMFYTGAPQNTNRADIDYELTKKAQDLMKENAIDINHVIVHAPYIINLANNGSNYDFAISFLKQEIKRVETLGIKKLVLHPGSHVGLGSELGIQNIIFALNQVIDANTNVIICLETMAGKGSECGITFEEIKAILDGMKYPEKVMVCLDTCHIHDAGYSIQDFDDTLKHFDEVIGLGKLGCLHINDSKNEQGSHKDRHENIGYGKIGFDALLHVIYHDKLKGIPKILETPYVSFDQNSKERMYPPYRFEIEMIRKKEYNPNLMEDIRAYYK